MWKRNTLVVNYLHASQKSVNVLLEWSIQYVSLIKSPHSSCKSKQWLEFISDAKMAEKHFKNKPFHSNDNHVVFLDAKFHQNNGSYLWDDGTMIALGEWKNIPFSSPHEPQVPKWIILRYIFIFFWIKTKFK